MGSEFAEYFAGRVSRMDANGRSAVRAFDHAYSFGSTLAQARQSRGLSQRALALAAKVQQSDISRIERGVMSPTTDTLLRITDALGARIVVQLIDGSELNATGDQPVQFVDVRHVAG